MRQKVNLQMTIWEGFASHSTGQELQAISKRLDQLPRIRCWAANDLIAKGTQNTGRRGMSVDSIIRAAIVQKTMGLTYDQLAFSIEDSLSVQAFTRLDRPPSASALQAAISRIKAGTWEKINHSLLASAARDGLEQGRKTRTDATVMDSPIHEPSDSSLLEDGLRLMLRQLRIGNEKLAMGMRWSDHRRICRKLVREIQGSGKKTEMRKAYRRLLKYVGITRDWLANMLVTGKSGELDVDAWRKESGYILSMVDQVIDQTDKRVIQGIKVPSSEKIVSLFEPHTDIIVKGKRRVQYGHKINLTTGASGLVIDMVVYKGNPADSTTVESMIQRQTKIYGRPPRQTSFDGGYTSKANLALAKKMGVKDVAFHKKRGLKVADMVKSSWVYRKLVDFRAGIEGNISTLKRRYGWYRCSWKGWGRFQAYAWSSVVAYNLITMARLSMGP